MKRLAWAIHDVLFFLVLDGLCEVAYMLMPKRKTEPIWRHGYELDTMQAYATMYLACRERNR